MKGEMNFDLEIEGLDEFISALKKIEKGGFAEQIGLWLEAVGIDFLDIVQDEIIRTKTVDTRWLLNSFQRSGAANIWSINKNGLTLEVGTNLNYASFVNDGHFTIDPSKGLDRRWVPGHWVGDRFVYMPGSKTGMLLKFTWIDGTGYWDNALAILEKTFEKSLDRLLQKWLDSNF